MSSPVLAAFIGDGPGRGWALVILVVGVLIALMVLLAFRSPRLRRLQADLPDVTPEDRLPQELSRNRPCASASPRQRRPDADGTSRWPELGFAFGMINA